jgi:hypothetical protein
MIMKFIKSKYKIILGLFLLASCTKDFRLVAPDDFQVSTEASTYRKGEPVKFSFTGNPQFISVYTGEVGKDYAFKDGRVMDVTSLKLSVNSSVTNGTGTGSPQMNMFSLMASTDFNGDYTSFSSIEAASWTDITSRLTKQEAATTTTINAATPPEGIDLTDLRVPGKPLYIAFKYNIREQSLYGIWRAWRFQAFTLSAITEAGTQILGNMTTTSFRVVQKNPEIISRTTATTATLTLMHSDLALYPQSADIPTQNWIITQGFNNVNKIDFGPDLTIPIQGGTSAVEKKDYSYTFTKAGNYKVYFIASNASTSERKDVIREVDITITD